MIDTNIEEQINLILKTQDKKELSICYEKLNSRINSLDMDFLSKQQKHKLIKIYEKHKFKMPRKLVKHIVEDLINDNDNYLIFLEKDTLKRYYTYLVGPVSNSNKLLKHQQLYSVFSAKDIVKMIINKSYYRKVQNYKKLQDLLNISQINFKKFIEENNLLEKEFKSFSFLLNMQYINFLSNCKKYYIEKEDYIKVDYYKLISKIIKNIELHKYSLTDLDIEEEEKILLLSNQLKSCFLSIEQQVNIINYFDKLNIINPMAISISTKEKIKNIKKAYIQKYTENNTLTLRNSLLNTSFTHDKEILFTKIFDIFNKDEQEKILNKYFSSDIYKNYDLIEKKISLEHFYQTIYFSKQKININILKNKIFIEKHTKEEKQMLFLLLYKELKNNEFNLDYKNLDIILNNFDKETIKNTINIEKIKIFFKDEYLINVFEKKLLNSNLIDNIPQSQIKKL